MATVNSADGRLTDAGCAGSVKRMFVAGVSSYFRFPDHDILRPYLDRITADGPALRLPPSGVGKDGSPADPATDWLRGRLVAAVARHSAAVVGGRTDVGPPWKVVGDVVSVDTDAMRAAFPTTGVS